MKMTIVTFIALLVLPAPLAHAVKPLNADALNDYCEGFSENAKSTLSQKCIAYVGGFLDGAIATDERVADNVAAEIEREESITQRAIRTRVAGRMSAFGPSVYAEFCVGDPVPIADVIAHVVEQLNEQDNLSRLPARTVVYDSLRKHYPCKES